MEKFFEGILLALGVMVLVAIIAVLGGTIIYWIWPVTFPVIFPLAVEKGIIPVELPWWTAVCLTWTCGILIKSSQTNNNSSK